MVINYRVRLCSKCSGNTEYVCVTCPCNLCSQCKKIHVLDLKTKDHHVTIYREKFKLIPKQDVCIRHPESFCRKYCEPCELPVCPNCTEHKGHKHLDVRSVYKTKRQLNNEILKKMRSEHLFYMHGLLSEIKADIKKCQAEFSNFLLTKAKQIITQLKRVHRGFNFKHRCLKQKRDIHIHVAHTILYESKYDQSATSPLEFILISKKTSFLQIHDISYQTHTSAISVYEQIKRQDVMKTLNFIKTSESKNRRVQNELLLKPLRRPELQKSLFLKNIEGRFNHISYVSLDRVWIGYDNELTLINLAGDVLYHLQNLYLQAGSHTVNNEGDLIYIGKGYNINKQSNDLKRCTTFIKRTEPKWAPVSVYWSPRTRELLVGMLGWDSMTCKVNRYSRDGFLQQTIQYKNTGQDLYKEIYYITENNNGDVVVSGSVGSEKWTGAIVVTERGGKHRFTHTGPHFAPRGICTDALSHILLCDDATHTVKVMDENGNFLGFLLGDSEEIQRPFSLSYDFKTHRLFVGTGRYKNNQICVYRYIKRRLSLTDNNE